MSPTAYQPWAKPEAMAAEGEKERGDSTHARAGDGFAVGAVAVGAGGGKIAPQIGIGSLSGGGRQQGEQGGGGKCFHRKFSSNSQSQTEKAERRRF